METVRIIVAETKQISDHAEQLLSEIAPIYVEKYHSHKISEDKMQELTAGYLLKKYLKITKDHQLRWNENGKPYLSEGNIYFNLSHSEGYVALAIADCEMGVDIERARKYHAATVKKVYSESQKRILDQLDGKTRDKKFTEIWTQLESYLKLKGTGFGEKWEKIEEDKCCIQTIRWADCFISCATRKPVLLQVENQSDDF